MTDDIEARARKVVAEITGHDLSGVSIDTKMVEALDLDSLDVLEMVMGFEEEFNVQFSDAEQTKWEADGCTLGGIVAIVQGKAA